VQIHKLAPLLSIFSLKLQWTEDSLKKAVWNRLCFCRRASAYHYYLKQGSLKRSKVILLPFSV